ncbi:MAG: DUF1232 domain-containing protein [Anaerolineales bacterium]
MSDATQTPTTETTPPETKPELPGIYARWRQRVHGWLAKRSRDELADAIFLVPDMLALVVRLMWDGRTPLMLRAQLLLVSLYVLLPVDIIPEALFGAAGLADDALIMSVMLMRILYNARHDLDPALLQEHWPGEGDIVTILSEIVDNSSELMDSPLGRGIRALLRLPEPPNSTQSAPRSIPQAREPES